MGSAQLIDTNKGYGEFVLNEEGNLCRRVRATGGALNYGETVIYDSADSDGYDIKSNAGADQVAVAGVMAETVASGSYGLVQVAGTHSALEVNGDSTNIAPGDQLSTGSVATKADKVKTSAAGAILGVSLDTSTTANDTIKALIKMA